MITPSPVMGAPVLGDAPPTGAPAPAPDTFGMALPEYVPTPPSNPAAPAWNASYSRYSDVRTASLPVSVSSSSTGSSDTGSVSL